MGFIRGYLVFFAAQIICWQLWTIFRHTFWNSLPSLCFVSLRNIISTSWNEVVQICVNYPNLCPFMRNVQWTLPGCESVSSPKKACPCRSSAGQSFWYPWVHTAPTTRHSTRINMEPYLREAKNCLIINQAYKCFKVCVLILYWRTSVLSLEASILLQKPARIYSGFWSTWTEALELIQRKWL